MNDTEQDLLVLDCRFDLTDPTLGVNQWSNGHIPGAGYADLDQDLSAPIVPGKTGRHPLPSPSAWQETLRRWGITPNTHIVLYDGANSMFAARAWWMLRWAGLSRVQVLDGGLAAWEGAGLPVDTEITVRAPTELTVTCPDDWLVSADDLLQQAEQYQLFDARALPRFSGETEPLDHKAGHIPGAVCADFAQNLQPDGRFRSATELRARFAALGLVPPVPAASPTCYTEAPTTVSYCGSGVTACHNILAMQLADLPQPLLYAGSWSEWINDDARPIATGNGSASTS
ncbi:MAG: sulfurtransferase [Natronospirillum sp.]